MIRDSLTLVYANILRVRQTLVTHWFIKELFLKIGNEGLRKSRKNTGKSIGYIPI